MMHYEFDRHSIIKRLIAVGITEAQAEELTNAIAEGRKHDLNNLATKMDVLETKAELKQEITEVKQEIAATEIRLSEKVAEIDKKLSEKITEVDKRLFERIEQSKNTMILWYISIAIAMTGIIISALKVF